MPELPPTSVRPSDSDEPDRTGQYEGIPTPLSGDAVEAGTIIAGKYNDAPQFDTKADFLQRPVVKSGGNRWQLLADRLPILRARGILFRDLGNRSSRFSHASYAIIGA